MQNWKSETIESNGLTLHYTRTGGDKPPLILTHGFSDDGLCWTPVAQALAENYDVIMVDARGHGRSDGPEEDYGSVEHAEDVAGVIHGLGLGKPIILGHSMGAATAMALAGMYPDLPGAILLEDPPAWWIDAPADVTPGSRRQRFGGWLVELKRKSVDEMIALCREQSPTWSEAELGPWAEAKLRLSFNVITSERAAPIDWPDVVGKIQCPVLLITADPAQGALVTAEHATALQGMIPQAQVVHIAGAGHNIRREQFARYMEVVQEFLATLMYRGACLCRAVTFEITGTLPQPNACHCSQCRKQSGHYWASTDVIRDAVTIHGNDSLTWFRSSEKVQRGFCATCGSFLFWDPIEKDTIAVAMGAFDQPTNTKLEMHIFVANKGDYYAIEDGLPQNQQ